MNQSTQQFLDNLTDLPSMRKVYEEESARYLRHGCDRTDCEWEEECSKFLSALYFKIQEQKKAENS